MATADLTAAQIFAPVAALLNDVAKSVYTDDIQTPYLNMALDELQEHFELANVPVTDTFSSPIINCPAGTTAIKFNVSPLPELPDDLIEPQIVWQRSEGINPYTMVGKVDNLPRWMEGTEISQIQSYVWQSQEIRFLACNADIDVKIDYIRALFTPVVSGLSTINVINAKTFLTYRTAALCAFFIGENKTRSDELDAQAIFGNDRVIGIGSKGRQSITTRRRPFRSGYKRYSVR